MRTVDFPLSRLGTFDIGVLSRRRHHMASFLELDITRVRGELRRHRREGEEISFTAWMLKAIASEMAADGEVNAMRYGRRKNVLFDDVDIALLVEKIVGGKAVPLPLVIRKADKKSAVEISREIEGAKRREGGEGSEGFVLGAGGRDSLMRLYYLLPQWLRVLLFGAVLRNPIRAQAMMGNAIYTSVGGAGGPAGWILPRSIHPICFAVGSINKMPRVRDGGIEAREILRLTVLIDHDVIDGAPAARFMGKLVRAIEGSDRQ
jgi:pyruvate/2-oxoglutarate dehydrogenase complex dihydrolipoamide acyltransferase (E2) component